MDAVLVDSTDDLGCSQSGDVESCAAREEQLTTTDKPFAVVLEGDRLTVYEYSTDDRSIVSHFRGMSPAEMSTDFEQCLSLGVRVAEVAIPTLDLGLVRREFDDTVRRQQVMLTEGEARLRQELDVVLSRLFGPTGVVPSAFKSNQESFEHELTKYFDDGSAKSVAAAVSRRVEETLASNERRLERQLQEALDITNEDRGLGRLYRAIRQEAATSSSQLTDLLGKISGAAARREERQTSTRKGSDYEEDVFREVARIARIYGDSAEWTGMTSGDENRRRGDIVVTLDSSAFPGQEVRFTLEAMDRSSGSQKTVLKELDEAKSNRSAISAIAVLASREASAASGQVLQHHSGGRFICVLEKETWDPTGLELAYCWARMEALKKSGPSSVLEGLDIAAAGELLESTVRDLGQLQRIRARLKVGREGLNDTDALLVEFEDSIRTSLNRLASLIRTE